MTISAGVDAVLYAGANDHVIELSLARRIEQTPLSGADVKVTMYEVGGDEVGGVAWPLTLTQTDEVTIEHGGVSYQAQQYAATIDAVSDIVENRRYKIVITSTHSEGFSDQFIFERVAVRREM